jgi:hypothetical protein
MVWSEFQLQNKNMFKDLIVQAYDDGEELRSNTTAQFISSFDCQACKGNWFERFLKAQCVCTSINHDTTRQYILGTLSVRFAKPSC